MKITLLCSSNEHPVIPYLKRWIFENSSGHEIHLVGNKIEVISGDILFLISCSEIIDKKTRSAFKKVLVVHASDLPKGRGWSPYIWEILEGAEQIVVSLLEAEDKVDSGDIWAKKNIFVPKHALWNEINHLIFSAELDLLDYAVNNFSVVQPQPQDQSIQPTYYPKRTPNDSRINPEQLLGAQFDLIRVCDPDRYPAFFELHGHTYIIRLERADE
jgi:methionyl-tRNA formyltransferase